VGATRVRAVLAWTLRDGALADRSVIAQHVGAVTALEADARFVVSAGRDGRVIRIPLAGGADVTATLSAPATVLAVDRDGEVHAVTLDSAVERAGRAVEIDRGVTAALALSNDRWILGHEDGALVIAPLVRRRLADLRDAVTRATRFTLR
jgi:hypothetical protein